jgi:light-regulated signal transduction histidine kinase (bacteriophytochrome)
MATDSLKQCADELEAAEKELASLSYSVSHDLRAPLRTIDGFSEALLDEYQNKLDDQGVDYLRRIRSAAARMEMLIGCLIELSRVSRDDLKRERVNLSELATSIASSLQKLEPARNVRFSIEPDLIVDGDPRLLRIAFEHLLGNAWKFTGRHATASIEVGREQRDGRHVLYVRDDGAGFDPLYAERMFGAFQRFHSSSEFEGTGIGLAMVQRIVHRHHGKVWAVGKVEQGTTVYLDLR